LSIYINLNDKKEGLMVFIGWARIKSWQFVDTLLYIRLLRFLPLLTMPKLRR